METKIGEKGRITLPIEIRRALGIREGDTIIIEPRGKEVILKPSRYVSVKDAEGVVALGRVKLEEVEEALGRK